MSIYWYRKTDFYRKNRNIIAFYNRILSLFSAACISFFLIGDQSDITRNHQTLSHDIKIMAVATGFYSGVFDINDGVLRAMARVPRHQFIRRPYKRLAYMNTALPVSGQDYMIPEPFITAMMMQLLDLDKTDKVLDIGFSSGYDAAVMSRLAHTVHAIEQKAAFPENDIYRPAEDKGFRNVSTTIADGTKGLEDEGPYDAILVRQSLRYKPRHLLNQLKPGGRLVVPIGAPGTTQRLMVYIKDRDHKIHEKQTLHLQVAPLLKGRQI